MNAKILMIVLGMCLSTAATATLAADTGKTKAPEAETGDWANKKRVRELEAVVKKAIKLLEEKKYEEVINLLMTPVELAKMKADDAKYAKAMEKFADKKAAKLLATLKEVYEFSPDEWNDDATRAVFETDTRPLVFIYVDGVWRIEGK
jgi:hypothetical protein